MSTYNTNLAAEFWVLSMLHRLGADASLTLGNKKAVDIMVALAKGRTLTIDVKGLAGSYDWPADNIRPPDTPRHFYVFLTFEGHIDDPTHVPSAWIVPAKNVASFMKAYKTRPVVSRALMTRKGKRFLHSWTQLIRGH